MLAYLIKQNFNFINIIPHDTIEEYRILLQKKYISKYYYIFFILLSSLMPRL